MASNEIDEFSVLVSEHCGVDVTARVTGSGLVKLAIHETAREALEPLLNGHLTIDEKVAVGAHWFASEYGVQDAELVIAATAYAVTQDPRTIELVPSRVS